MSAFEFDLKGQSPKPSQLASESFPALPDIKASAVVNRMLKIAAKFGAMVDQYERDPREAILPGLVAPLLGNRVAIGGVVYELERLIGSGSEGVVFSAKDPKGGGDVAIKLSAQFDLGRHETLRDHKFILETEYGAGFRNECRALTIIKNAGISDVQEFIGAALLRDPKEEKAAGVLVTRLVQGARFDHLQQLAIAGQIPLQAIAESYARLVQTEEKVAGLGLAVEDVGSDNAIVKLDSAHRVTNFAVIDFGATYFYSHDEIEDARAEVFKSIADAMRVEIPAGIGLKRGALLSDFFADIQAAIYDLADGTITCAQCIDYLRNIKCT